MFDPTTITEKTITTWECARDLMGGSALFARLTRGGVWKARDLLYTACWFARRWRNQRHLLHPLLRYQVRPSDPAPAASGGPLAAGSPCSGGAGAISPGPARQGDLRLTAAGIVAAYIDLLEDALRPEDVSRMEAVYDALLAWVQEEGR